METVFVMLVCVGLMLFGLLTPAQVSLFSTDEIVTAWREREDASAHSTWTTVTSLGIEYAESGVCIDLSEGNDGETGPEDFDHWDVILEYHSHACDELPVNRLDYTDLVLAVDHWAVERIHLDTNMSDSEVFEPGILDADKEMVVQMTINPVASAFNGTIRAIVATLKGVTALATSSNG